MKKYILLLIIPFLSFGQKLSEQEIKKYLKEEAAELNKMLPMQADNYTTIRNVYTKNKTVTINYATDYTFFIDNEVNESEFLISQQELLINTFCTDPLHQIYRDNNVTYIMRYSDEKGNHIGEVKVNNTDCE